MLIYLLPLILTSLLHTDLINVASSSHVSLSGHDDVAFLNNVAEWTQNTIKYAIITSLKSEPMG